MAVKKTLRGKGYGDELMRVISQYIAANFKGFSLDFSAQLYLKNFYEKHGFVAVGDVYDEGGIAHINMKSVDVISHVAS